MGIRDDLQKDLIGCLSDAVLAKKAIAEGNPTEATHLLNQCCYWLGKCLGTLSSVDELEHKLARLREQEEQSSMNEPPEYDEPLDETWDRAEGHTQADGSIIVYWSTNDDEDRGYPSAGANAEYKCKDKEVFLKQWGKSRQGCAGCRVERYLDGEKI